MIELAVMIPHALCNPKSDNMSILNYEYTHLLSQGRGSGRARAAVLGDLCLFHEPADDGPESGHEGSVGTVSARRPLCLQGAFEALDGFVNATGKRVVPVGFANVAKAPQQGLKVVAGKVARLVE